MRNKQVSRAVRLVKEFLATDFGIALIITLVWKIIITAIGYIIDVRSGTATSLFDHTVWWDANWYLAIVTHHYTDPIASAAFYPLFPFLVSVVHFMSFGGLDYPVAAQLINTASVWLGLVAAIKIGRLLLGQKNRFWIVALLLSAPAAFFMHTFYSEAVFIALSFWAYYFALKKQWLWVGILLGALTAARLPSVLIIALCGLEFLRSYDWNIKRALNKKALYFLIAPIGFIAFSLYLGFAQHDPLGMFHAYKATSDWAYQVFNPNIIETMAKAAYQIVRVGIGARPFDLGFVVNILLPLVSLVILGLSSLYLLIKHPKTLLPLGIVGILSIIMFTLNSNVVSIHRYALPSLTIYVAIGLLLKSTAPKWQIPLIVVVCGLSLCLQFYLYAGFIQHLFVG